MALERTPITRLEEDQTYLNNRLEAFQELDTRLNSFADKIKNLNYSSTLLQRSVKQSSEEFVSASADSGAVVGGSYQVEVVSLAQVQKSVSEGGYADKNSALFGTGTLNIEVGGVNHALTLDSSNNSLQGLMKAINEADIGISASIINTGDETAPFRLSLAGTNVAKDFSMDTSGLSGGEELSIGTPIQEASKALIRVDTVEISSDSNTISEAIPGMTLDLVKAEEGTTTTLNVNVDKESIRTELASFAEGYNEVMSFITDQSAYGDQEGGVIGSDASVNAIKRRMQSLLTEITPNSGVFKTISQLGFETQKDGSLEINETTLNNAINNNLEDIATLLSGEEGVTGTATKFKNYLFDMTNSGTGLLRTKQDSIEKNLTRIDSQISVTEARLDMRQKTLEAQFSAMETLVSGLNTQADYLTQQMENLSSMMSGGK